MQPLAGVRILDFSTLLPGPLATLMLAEAGAKIIRIERPGGEDMRRFAPFIEGRSAPFAVLNGGKDCVAVDLKDPGAMDILRPLIESADILVEQFRPGVMERLGLGYDAVRRINPKLIYCSITGFGQTGPRSGEAGHDINYQALTGLLSLSPGTPDTPSVPPALTADIAGGSMPAVINILLALRQRDLTGEGTHLDIAMADAMFTFAWIALAEGHATARYPGPREQLLAGGSPRYQLYATADDRFLAVGALEQKFWNAFCEGVGLEAALRDDRKSPTATRDAIVAIVRGKDSAHWRTTLEPLDCCATIVRSLEEALADAHFVERALFAFRAQIGDGDIAQTMVPIAPAFRRSSRNIRPVADKQ